MMPTTKKILEEEREAWLKEFGPAALTPGFDPERARAYQRAFVAELKANADWINAEIQRGQKSEVDSE